MGAIFRDHQYVFTQGAIRIRPLQDHDLDMLQKWGDDPEVLYFSEGDDVTHYDIEDIKGIYRGVKDSAYCFIIEYGGMRIGECWLQRMNDQDLLDAFPGRDLRRIDLSIGEKDYWNRGIGPIVIKMLSAFGFENQSADMIFYLPYDYNKRSIRAADKAEYKMLSTTPVKDSAKARYRVNMAMTRDDYRKETGMVKETGIREEGITIANKARLTARHKSSHAPYEYYRYDVTERNGKNQCHVAFYEIPPGKENYPYHYHTNSTEVFYIISGSGVMATPDGEKSIAAGDVIVCRPNELGAHKIRNTSEADMLTYLDCDTVSAADIAFYPDSDKLGIILNGKASAFYKTNSQVDYFLDE